VDLLPICFKFRGLTLHHENHENLYTTKFNTLTVYIPSTINILTNLLKLHYFTSKLTIAQVQFLLFLCLYAHFSPSRRDASEAWPLQLATLTENKVTLVAI